MSETTFDARTYLPLSVLDQVTDLRLNAPDAIIRHALQRQRRTCTAPSGKLVVLAADHPGRMVTDALGDELVMGDRGQYLARIMRVLGGGLVDGLMATADVIEEVLALDVLLTRAGRSSLLDNMLLIGCMNRGGLQGVVFEMCDRFTAYTAEGLAQMNLDGAKLMFRLEPNDPASGETIYWCAEAINACLERNLPVFLEPLMVQRTDSGYKVQKDAASLVRGCSVAAALGRSSLGTWLKLPCCPDYERVARSTTLPILMLGGQAEEDPLPLLGELHAGMAAGANVRGALIGRNVLFPGTGDPLVMAAAVRAVIHDGADARAALAAGLKAVKEACAGSSRPTLF